MMAMDWGWGMGCCLDLETESGFPKDSVMVTETDLAMATDWEWAKGCYLDSETVWGSQMDLATETDLAMAKDSA
jgi:hypothetical protein